MNTPTDEANTFPIGRFTAPLTNLTAEQRMHQIQTIRDFPDKIRDLLGMAGEQALEARYRPGSWTLRQIVHHCADSHMNAYIRHKLTITEDSPTVKPYEQDDWAELNDARSGPVEVSVQLLSGLHARWALFLSGRKEADWERAFYHPESKRSVPLFESLALYAWHCEHHLGQMRVCLESVGRLP